MTQFATILQQIPPLQATEKIAILELNETRLGLLLLRPSPIWTYAIIYSPKLQPDWAQTWQQLVENATPADIEDLRHYGQAPGGRNLVSALETAVFSMLPVPGTSPTHILPIGALAKGEFVIGLLTYFYPDATILAPQPTLHLPVNCRREAIYKLIAQSYPPQVPANYYLKTAVLDGNQQKLAFKNEPIFKQGDTPYSSMSEFLEKHLYRAISQSPTPIQIELFSDNPTAPLFRRVINPSHNIFTLKVGFNYMTDALYCDLFDNQNMKLEEVPLNTPISEELPHLRTQTTIDIAIIVDGTLRQKRQIYENGIPIEQWQPDLSAVRKYLAAILERLSSTTTFDARVALCLYGDNNNARMRDWKYLWQPSSFQPLSDLYNHLQRQNTQIIGTDDLDYEAALEKALQWANPNSGELQWRPSAQKFLVVIGYAPPHPPTPTNGQPFVYPKDTELTHEPFTSPINWYQELLQIQYPDIQVIPVWTPPIDELGREHRCIRYSYNVWYQLGEKQKQDPIEGLQENSEDALWQRLTAVTPDKLITNAPIHWPLATQIHQLRIVAPPQGVPNGFTA